MDMIGVRRKMLMGQKSGELYPVGANLFAFCNVFGTETRYTAISYSTGELVESQLSSQSASEIYIPINPQYTYEKSKRLYVLAFYDANKTFISATGKYNNTTDNVVISDIPNDARFIRISFVYNNRVVKLVRTA